MGYSFSDLDVRRVEDRGWCIVLAYEPDHVVEEGFSCRGEAVEAMWEGYDDCD